MTDWIVIDARGATHDLSARTWFVEGGLLRFVDVDNNNVRLFSMYNVIWWDEARKG